MSDEKVPVMIYDGTRSMRIYDVLIGAFGYAEDSKGIPIGDIKKDVRKIGENEVGLLHDFSFDESSDMFSAEVLYVGKDDMTVPRKVPQAEFKEYELVR